MAVKRRQESARLSIEDQHIWKCIERMFWCQPWVGNLVPLWREGILADRRDADFMLCLRLRRQVNNAPMFESARIGEWEPVGGALPR